MKANSTEQLELLNLSALDAEISRAKRSIASLQSGEQHAAQQAAIRELSSELLAARNALDEANLELSRAEADIKLVEARVAKDEAALKQTSVPSIATGIQHELATLARRKGELEDMELSILERQEVLQVAFAEVQAKRAALDAELSDLRAVDEQQAIKFQSGVALQLQDRATLVGRIPQELLAAYERKATRGVPVGRLENRNCSACHLGLDAVAYSRITGLPNDEFAECPDCGAFMVRG